MLRRSVSWLTSAALIAGTMPAPLHAQTAVPVPAGPFQMAQAPMPGLPPGPAQPVVAIYNAEQLDAILAPIALYPDVLLIQVLMSSAFPLQLVDASRWLQQDSNRNLRGPALEQALAGKNWDPSVKSLVPFPQVIAQLTSNLEWLQDLGTAAAQQQEDVMDSIQRLRQLAAAAGNLRTNDQCVVRTQDRYIYIEPVQPELIYVPVYNPTVVYGTWAYPAYPPVYLPPPPGYGWGPVVGTALVFGIGVVVTAALWNLGRPRWHDRRIYVDVHRYNRININRPHLREERWHPRHTSTFSRGGLVDTRGAFVAPRAAGITPFGGPAPGSRPGASGFTPNQQFRDRGAPGTAGHSGIVPPGQQFRDRGAPGTAGHSGIRPPGFEKNGGSPSFGGGSSQFRPATPSPSGVGTPHYQRPSGGSPQQFQPQGGSGGGGGGGAPQRFQRPSGGGGGGGSQHQPFRPQGSSGGSSFHGSTSGGGGSSYRPSSSGGGGSGSHGNGGGSAFRSQPSGGGGSSFHSSGGGSSHRPSSSGGGGSSFHGSGGGGGGSSFHGSGGGGGRSQQSSGGGRQDHQRRGNN